LSYLSLNELKENQNVIPLRPVARDEFEQWKKSAPPAHRQWVEDSGFKSSAGKFCALPATDGGIEYWLFGVRERGWINRLSVLAAGLPEGVYRLECGWSREQRAQASLGWGLALYRFERYKAGKTPRPLLLLGEDIDSEVRSLCEAQCLVRDLVNTPTEHMGPAQLADAVSREADRFDAVTDTVAGDDLLSRNFPAIHAVGAPPAGSRRCSN